MEVAVLGCGRWGKNIIRTLSELEESLNFSLNEVVNTGNKERKKQIKNDYNIPCHTNLDRALKENTSIIIATPDDTHDHLIRKALNHENNVFVEKPIAFKLEEAKKLLQLGRKKDRLLMVGHLMIFHPFLEVLRNHEGFDRKLINEIDVTRFNNLRDSGERRLLHSSLVHDLAVLDKFFASLPQTIDIFKTLGPFPSGNYLNAQMTYNNIPVHLEVRTDWPLKRRLLSFRCEKYFYQFNGIKETLTIIDTDNPDETVVKEFNEFPLTRELKNFINAVKGKENCEVEENHVLRVMKTMEQLETKMIPD